MIARANGENGWVDPHNGGSYSFTSTTSTDIAGTRTTGDSKYTDKYDFHFEADGSGCKVSPQSLPDTVDAELSFLMTPPFLMSSLI